MKRLYENIEHAHIIGGPGALSEVVTAMDDSLRGIAENSEKIIDCLEKYSASENGVQYANVVETAHWLRDEMVDASLSLNDMQKDIVKYQNKLNRYEGLPENAPAPNPPFISQRKVNPNASDIQIHRPEMIEISKALKEYSDSVTVTIDSIVQRKDSIAGVWRDEQYNVFSDFVDKTAKKISNAVKVYGNYVAFLDEKLKELR